MKQSFLLVFLALALGISAQNCDTLSGRVIDKNGEALIVATIKVMQDTQVVRGAITDFEGNFRLILERGDYDLECSYTGFKTMRLSQVASDTTGYVVVLHRDEGLVCDVPSYYSCVLRIALIDQSPGNTGVIWNGEQLRNIY